MVTFAGCINGLIIKFNRGVTSCDKQWTEEKKKFFEVLEQWTRDMES